MSRKSSRTAQIFRYAITAAIVGLVVGWIAQSVYMPRYSGPPMIALLITGPLGAVMGAMYGWSKRTSRYED
jgi:uncharacterized membrane protein YeaQ/YmgE (transglycosylase-associated protein family)